MHTFAGTGAQALIKDRLCFSVYGDTPDAFNFFPSTGSQLASRSPCFIGAWLQVSGGALILYCALNAFGSSCEMVRAPTKGSRQGRHQKGASCDHFTAPCSFVTAEPKSGYLKGQQVWSIHPVFQDPLQINAESQQLACWWHVQWSVWKTELKKQACWMNSLNFTNH